MIKNTTQGQRIKLARKAKGLTQTELAERAGLKGHTLIQNYEKDRRGGEHPNLALLLKIAEVTEVTIDWLLAGKEDKNKSNNRQDIAEIYPTIQNFAPIISWEEIRAWKTLRKNMSFAHREQLPLFDKNGLNCFGLRVKDDSMVSSIIDGDSFKENDVLIIDPEVKAEINDYVIVSMDENEPLLLRKFIKDEKGFILKALNNLYQDHPFSEKVIFYGVVVGQHRSFTKK